MFRRKLSRSQLLGFLARLPACTVAMEACASAHFWGREAEGLGHRVRLIAPAYVKPFVKRQKNDMADAEAIAEAASRPTMRFVAVKSEAAQERAMLFRTRDLLVRQRTQAINALRGHLAEFGVVAPQGPAQLKVLAAALGEAGGGERSGLPAVVRELGAVYLALIGRLTQEIARLEVELRRQAAAGEATARLMTMPGVGPVTALAIEAFAPPMAEFRRRARLRGLARAGAEAAFERRPGTAGEDLEDGTARHPPVVDRGGDGTGPLGGAQRGAAGLVAGAHAGEKAAAPGGDRARQPDGALGLGDADAQRGLPGTGGGRGLRPAPSPVRRGV
jgi:hypothetical protein